MPKLLVTLGTTPGGIFETFENLKRGNYEAENHPPVHISEVYVIRTSDPAVNLAWKLVKAVFACCGGKEVTIADIPLEINDINSKQDFLTFKRAIKARLSPGDFVDFTGGRKAMSVAAAIEAREAGAKVVTTIIPQQEYVRITNLLNSLKGQESAVEAGGRGECVLSFCDLVSKESRTVQLY
ncbi:CRISPR-associated ring nuclease Crn1 [Metallosphaera hakonensis]|uniref:CRISPR-associated protein n=1 Tax=Metallosphaera hakonensis JCM 8857 = DSM 7519 TaxID=1293036 RepID=A0A2U9IRQ5_9CREN|nr:CRISPR-associated ring nuclease Crn1 [Metallosphaera hakonensis]AWR98668.1 CRISPR-associated protein [Metallosphaera hakonensis JCM 8857 = DSM 7519]